MADGRRAWATPLIAVVLAAWLVALAVPPALLVSWRDQRLAEVSSPQAQADWDQAVLGAIEDVESALVAYRQIQDRLEALRKAEEDARNDLATQVDMFDSLYDTSAVTIVPSSTDAGFTDALIAWTKQKETKRGFAVYTAELYSRGLIPEATMAAFVKTVVDDLRDSIRHPRTPPTEEHVDHLVRFLAAVAPKVKEVKPMVAGLLAVPRPETPSLCMKSRFKLEDVAKA